MNVACFPFRLYKGLQWERSKKILALVPPKGASSTDSFVIQETSARRRSFSEEDDLDFSSEPRSIPSSLERLNILDSSTSEQEHDSFSLLDQEEVVQCSPNDIFINVDKETIPLTPMVSEMFPQEKQYDQLPVLNSVSSVLSPMITPVNQKTRFKRNANQVPWFVC